MKLKFKVLILIGIILIGSSYFIIDELLYINTLKTAFGEEYANLNCWGYNYIQESGSKLEKLTNQKLPVDEEERVTKMRELLNKNYAFFVNSLNSESPINYSNIVLLSSSAISVSLPETVYAILKDKIPDEKPSACTTPVNSLEDVDKVMQVSFAFTTAAIWAGWSQNIVSENNEYCTNQTNYNKCMKNWISLLKNASETKKNSLPEYKEASLPDCGRTLVYKDSKITEKELRSQLANATDGFSILWKSMQIEMYDKCSEELYNIIKDNPCDLSQLSKSKSLSMVLGGNGLLGGCIQSYLTNETSKLSEQLNLTKIS